VKKIETIVKPYQLNRVKDALNEAGLYGLTVSEIRGFGPKWGTLKVIRDGEYKSEMLRRLRVEIIVPDNDAAFAITAMAKGAGSGCTEDPKIIVSTVEQALPLLTEESPDQAS
jgi:nitrogen regulatory protein P-II 1